MMGKLQDWENIKKKLSQIRKIFNEVSKQITKWIGKLDEIIDEFINTYQN